MTNKKPTYITIEAELNYPKVFERNRDMGNHKVDHSDVGGIYSVDMVFDDDAKEAMIDAGVPEKSMGYDMFKPTEDGRWAYKAKRKHLNPYLKDDETGEPVVNGPPEVVDLNKPFFDEDSGRRGYEAWDPDVNIGNGSTGRVKLQIVHGRGKIVNLIKIGVSELVEYEGGDGF